MVEVGLVVFCWFFFLLFFQPIGSTFEPWKHTIVIHTRFESHKVCVLTTNRPGEQDSFLSSIRTECSLGIIVMKQISAVSPEPTARDKLAFGDKS